MGDKEMREERQEGRQWSRLRLGVEERKKRGKGGPRKKGEKEEASKKVRR